MQCLEPAEATAFAFAFEAKRAQEIEQLRWSILNPEQNGTNVTKRFYILFDRLDDGRLRVILRRLDSIPRQDSQTRTLLKDLSWSQIDGWSERLKVNLFEGDTCLWIPANPTSDCIELVYLLKRFKQHGRKSRNRIPKQIFQRSRRREYWLEKPLVSFQEMNPGWQWLYYTDEAIMRQQILDFEGPRALAAYDMLLPGSFKSDLWRMTLLYHLGGVYADDKLCLFHPLDLVLPDGDEVDGLLVQDLLPKHVHTTFVAIVPQHPFMRCAIDRVIANVEARFYGTDPIDVTGPTVLGECYEALSAEQKARLPIKWDFPCRDCFIRDQLPRYTFVFYFCFVGGRRPTKASRTITFSLKIASTASSNPSTSPPHIMICGERGRFMRTAREGG